jgi:hypothetical protein
MAEMPDLEGLLTRAMLRQKPQKERRKPGAAISIKELAEAEKRVREQFYAPENWIKGRTIALVHDETETLLGNFAEFHSRLEKTARRLVRVDAPAAVDAIERVSGANWLNPVQVSADQAAPGAVAEEDRDAIIDLHMPELDNVFAPDVLVSVILHWGSIAKVILHDETRFFSKDKRVQLILPSGMDVREGLSLETRVRLKEFLGL